MKQHCIGIICGLLMVLIRVEVTSATDKHDFRWKKPVVIENAAANSLISVPFDSSIYGNTRDGFPDVRLLDSEMNPVPCLIRKQIATRSESKRVQWTAKKPELTPGEAGLEIKLKLEKDDPQPSGLIFVTPLKSFDQQVDVFGTEPGQAEQQLVSSAILFDYSQYMDVRRLEVPLKSNQCREFRLVLKALTTNQESEVRHITRFLMDAQIPVKQQEQLTIQRRAFRLDRIDFWSDSKKVDVKSDAEVGYDVSKINIEQNSDKHQTIVTLTTKRQPLTGLEMTTPHSNFRRKVRVLIPETDRRADHAKTGTFEEAQWREISSGLISKFEIGDVQEQNLKVTFPEQRQETYRLVIDNLDSRPVEFEGFKAWGRAYEAVFLTTETPCRWIAYGSKQAEQPNYDLAAVQLAIDRGVVTVDAILGTQTELTPAAEPEVDVKSALSNPVLIGAVVCVLVVVMGFSLMRAEQRISALPSSESTDESNNVPD